MRGLLPSSVLSLHQVQLHLRVDTSSGVHGSVRRTDGAVRSECEWELSSACGSVVTGYLLLQCLPNVKMKSSKQHVTGYHFKGNPKGAKRALAEWPLQLLPPFFSSSPCVQDGSRLASPPAAIRPQSAGGFRFPIRRHSGDDQQHWVIDKQYKNFRKLHQPLHFLHCCRAFGVFHFRSSHRNRGWLVTGRDISVHRRPLDSGSGPLFTGV